MDALFLKLLNMSIAASWLIVAVILLRLLLKKAPKGMRCVLWTLVALRLLCPFSLESAWSLVPSTETLPPTLISGSSPSFNINTGVGVIDAPANEYPGAHYFEGVSVPANNGSRLMTVLGWVWLAGLAAMLLHASVSYLRLRRRVGAALPLGDKIWLCDAVETPFILGLLKPRVYLPSDIGEEQISYVIAHERAHLKRRDHWWKPLGFLIMAIHWFNPLVWLAYILLCRDIELACDERVIREMGLADKKAYSDALLSYSLPRPVAVACPLAFGEVGAKERIKAVLNYKKPAFWLVAAAVAACAVAAVCFLTDPKEQDLSFLNYKNLASLAYQSGVLAVRQDGIAGYVDGQAFGAFLDTAAWREKRMTSPLELSADVTIIFNDGLELRFYESEPALAMVVSNGEWRYYNMRNTQYEAITELLEAAGVTGKVLSLNDVIILSQKGEELSWQDFDQYAYTETGSGLYIRLYEINPLFSLWIGGSGPTRKPIYIRLTVNTEPESYIDIRTESVTDFISAHQNDVPAEYGWQSECYVLLIIHPRLFSMKRRSAVFKRWIAKKTETRSGFRFYDRAFAHVRGLRFYDIRTDLIPSFF